MNKLKSVLLAIALIAICSATRAEKSLIIDMTDGTIHSFVLSSQPVITFRNAKLVVNGALSSTYSLQSVVGYHVGEPTALGDLKDNEVRISYSNNQSIVVAGLNAGAELTLMDVRGTVIGKYTMDNESTTINLPASSGVYLLHAGQQTYKIMKQ